MAVVESWQRSTPVCAAAFRAEETSQAGGVGRLGSSVFSGLMSIEDARAALAWDGTDPHNDLAVADVALPSVFLELHVEQGPRLERSGDLIGAVEGANGYVRWRARLCGRADHVGTAPMDSRRDALAAAAEIVLAVERLGRTQLDVASVGFLEVRPNRVGVVAAEVVLTADLRCWTDGERDAAVEDLRAEAEAVSARRNIRIETQILTHTPTVRFDERVVDAVQTAARAAGARVAPIASAASHDAVTLAHVRPAGMLFVPSKGGRSHTPDEYTSAQACETGAVVLASAAADLARRIRPGKHRVSAATDN
jgi:hydantoinase/carbamoylase family amidase